MGSRLIAFLAAVACASGCASDSRDRFSCGKHGGTCALGTEICVVAGADACSTCVAAPPAYTANPSCDSVPAATDEMFGNSRCVDDGVCGEVEGGAVVTCAEATWFCG